ncbi:MAG: hypothetical protein ACRD4X_02405 [Candidatus Acidiferrales bacterium]
MIQLILFLLVGALLFASLVVLARRGSRPEGGAEALVQARQALTHLQADLLPPELVDRFLAAEDFEYVASAALPEAHALFFQERKRIVIAWLGQVRQQIKTLRRFHLGAARFYARMGLRSEVALALDFANVLVACRALQILVYFGGPRVAPRMVGAAVATGQRICEAYDSALAFLTARAGVADRSLAS